MYSYLFVEFDKFWLSEKPKDVMEFNRIRDLFENQMRTLLEDRSAHFKINIAVDNVWKKSFKTNSVCTILTLNGTLPSNISKQQSQ